MKNDIIALRINKNDKNNFKKLCDKVGYSISEVLLDYVKTAIKNKNLKIKIK